MEDCAVFVLGYTHDRIKDLIDQALYDNKEDIRIKLCEIYNLLDFTMAVVRED